MTITRLDIAEHVRDAFGDAGANREDLIATAVDNHAPPAVLDALRNLPDRTFRRLPDLWPHLQGIPVA